MDEENEDASSSLKRQKAPGPGDLKEPPLGEEPEHHMGEASGESSGPTWETAPLKTDMANFKKMDVNFKKAIAKQVLMPLMPARAMHSACCPINGATLLDKTFRCSAPKGPDDAGLQVSGRLLLQLLCLCNCQTPE